MAKRGLCVPEVTRDLSEYTPSASHDINMMSVCLSCLFTAEDYCSTI